MKDFLVGLLLLGLGVFGLLWIIPNGVNGGEVTSVALSAAFWPVAVVVLFTLFGLILTVQAGVACWQRKEPSPDQGGLSLGMCVAIFLLIPYYFLAESYGFPLASIFAFAAYALLAGEKNYKGLAFLSVVVPMAITVFFVQIAQVLVPLGPLGSLFL